MVNRRSPAEDGELLKARRHAEDRHLEELRSSIADDPYELPLLASEPVGEDGVAAVARLLGG